MCGALEPESLGDGVAGALWEVWISIGSVGCDVIHLMVSGLDVGGELDRLVQDTVLSSTQG